MLSLGKDALGQVTYERLVAFFFKKRGLLRRTPYGRDGSPAG